MLRRLALLTLAILVGGPVAARQSPSDSGVHATLRIAGNRDSFKNGEPIRLELVLTADRPGFFVDTAGTDDATDVMRITPAEDVHRLQPVGWRDYLVMTELSAKPTVLSFAVNYWARFDTAGVFTVALENRRVFRREANGARDDRQVALPTTNPVSFRIAAPDAREEEGLISAAVQHLQSAVAMGGDKALHEQIQAAEELAFLPGDAAAIEKYRWYRRLGSLTRIPSNAAGVLRRGFMMSRNPGVILVAVEAELLDPNTAASFDAISNAASLAVAVKYPGLVEPSFPVPDDSGPFATERARYLELVHASLDRRVGVVKILSAGAMLDILVERTPADVVRLIVDGFEQLPLESRVWFVSGRWDVIRDPKLGPALRRTLDEVEPGSRSYVYPALIDVAPGLAVEPLAKDILDPKRIITDEIVKKVPRSSLSHVGPRLLETIREMSKAAAQEPSLKFRVEQKITVLAAVADGSLRRELRDLYDSLGPSPGYGVREDLLTYLLEWDPDEGTRRARDAIRAAPDGSTLYRLGQSSPSPGLSALLRERVLDQDSTVASEAASLLAAKGSPDDRHVIDARLVQWRLAVQGRLANGESLSKADGEFESALLRALALSKRWTLSTVERDRLLSACLTDACKNALRERR
ncbi:MAG TPA: hypothetical protein VN700_08660 [Vicinamibacterales bacterium]|nr:hypothetical protein [Vicinamibacterales bacterium]